MSKEAKDTISWSGPAHIKLRIIDRLIEQLEKEIKEQELRDKK